MMTQIVCRRYSSSCIPDSHSEPARRRPQQGWRESRCVRSMQVLPTPTSGRYPDVVLVVGVFGNVTDDDLWRLMAFAPQLCRPGATLVWSRARMWLVTRGDARVETGIATFDGTPARRCRASRNRKAERNVAEADQPVGGTPAPRVDMPRQNYVSASQRNRLRYQRVFELPVRSVRLVASTATTEARLRRRYTEGRSTQGHADHIARLNEGR